MPDITITLPQDVWNVVLQALGELPAKDSMNIIGAIQGQAHAQLNPPKPKRVRKAPATKK